MLLLLLVMMMCLLLLLLLGRSLRLFSVLLLEMRASMFRAICRGLDLVNSKQVSNRSSSTSRQEIGGLFLLAQGTDPDFLALAVYGNGFARVLGSVRPDGRSSRTSLTGRIFDDFLSLGRDSNG